MSISLPIENDGGYFLNNFTEYTDKHIHAKIDITKFQPLLVKLATDERINYNSLLVFVFKIFIPNIYRSKADKWENYKHDTPYYTYSALAMNKSTYTFHNIFIYNGKDKINCCFLSTEFPDFISISIDGVNMKGRDYCSIDDILTRQDNYPIDEFQAQILDDECRQYLKHSSMNSDNNEYIMFAVNIGNYLYHLCYNVHIQRKIRDNALSCFGIPISRDEQIAIRKREEPDERFNGFSNMFRVKGILLNKFENVLKMKRYTDDENITLEESMISL